jgi:hypothetical protein
MVRGVIVKSIKDAIAIASTIIESAERELAWLVPAPMLAMAAPYNLDEKSKVLIQKGGRVRAITTISSPYVEIVRRHLELGEDVRHVEHYGEVFLLVADNKQSISSIHVNVEDLSADAKILAFWSQEPAYTEYLMSNFEQAWAQGVDAQKHISELLKEGTSQA